MLFSSKSWCTRLPSHCVIIEKWRKSLAKSGMSRPLIADLSKAFVCILHDLLAAHGFDYNYLQLLQAIS